MFDASLIVPEFNSSVFAEIAKPSASVSPASTVYEKTISVEPLPDAYVAYLPVKPCNGTRGVPVTVTDSENVTFTLTASPALYAPVDENTTDDTVGAVASGVPIVTVTDCGDPVSVVCAFPAESVIEKPAAAVNVDTVAPPPSTAVDVAEIVHTVEEVWAMFVIAEIFVNVKSTPEDAESVEHVTASLPVTVKLIDVDVAVEEVTLRVTVGAVVSPLGVPCDDDD